MAALRVVEIGYSPPEFRRIPAVHAPDADFAVNLPAHCAEILVWAASRTNRPTRIRIARGREGPQQSGTAQGAPVLSNTPGVVADGSGGHEACVLVPQRHPK